MEPPGRVVVHPGSLHCAGKLWHPDGERQYHHYHHHNTINITMASDTRFILGAEPPGRVVVHSSSLYCAEELWHPDRERQYHHHHHNLITIIIKIIIINITTTSASRGGTTRKVMVHPGSLHCAGEQQQQDGDRRYDHHHLISIIKIIINLSI